MADFTDGKYGRINVVKKFVRNVKHLSFLPSKMDGRSAVQMLLGGRNSSLVVFGLAVHSVAGSILLWGNFPIEGIFPLELTWVQTPFPPKLFRMRV